MLRPLRIRHRRIFTVLGVLLPVVFGLGIAAQSSRWLRRLRSRLPSV